MDLDFLEEEPLQQEWQHMDEDFCGRPAFPAGLRVLLLEADSSASVAAQRQLRDCGYDATPCSSLDAACQLLNSPMQRALPFDVLLADLPTIGGDSDDAGAACEAVGLRQLLEAAGDTPLVLMGAACSPRQVLTGVQCGAADFLDKPLSLLKLKNIWQHSVRRSMARAQSGTMTSSHYGSPQAAAQPSYAAAAGSAADLSAVAEAAMAAAAMSTAALDTAAAAAAAYEDPLDACCSLLDDVDTTFTCFDTFSDMLTDEEVYQEVDALLATSDGPLFSSTPSDSGNSSFGVGGSFSTGGGASSSGGWVGEGSGLVKSEGDSSGADATSAKLPASGANGSSCESMQPSATQLLPVVAGVPATGMAAAACMAPVAPMMMMAPPPDMCLAPGQQACAVSTWLPPGMVWGMPCPIVATVPGLAMPHSSMLPGLSWPSAAMGRSNSMFMPGAYMLPPQMFAAPAAGRMAPQQQGPAPMARAASAPAPVATALAVAAAPSPFSRMPPVSSDASGIRIKTNAAALHPGSSMGAVAAPAAGPQQLPMGADKQACARLLLPNELLFGGGCRTGAPGAPLGLKLHKSSSLADFINMGLAGGAAAPA